MALTYTPEAQIGSACPDFQLPSVDGKSYSLSDFNSNHALVVYFICNHCPYVKAIEDRLIELALEMQDQGIDFVAICSNDPTDYPEDSFENLKKRWMEKKYPFPYLHDSKQTVAQSFGAVCTPDIFVYNFQNNTKGELYYRGRLDDSWKNPDLVKTRDLHQALSALLAHQSPPQEVTPSMGCSIKWIE